MKSDAEFFHESLERPAMERAAFLLEACHGAEQRTRVEALLRAHERVPGALPAPIDVRARLVDPAGETIIGHFKLLEKIGEGGCGAVWMAQQEQPMRRRVALKVIKLGMDTKEVIARFEAERQALAMMNHPNIARVFEAGATETGRPYFAMELVRGLPITRYCDERNLSTADRLTLFVQVCRALQHAHENGIVHRDIKPSNILVTHDGDAPMPKVIDFGIAKATEGRLTDRTLFTAFEQFLGTPAYMSPEQADFNAQEIDARSDVYSLGALLYELLAGRPPFDPKSLASAGINEVRRIIREVDPPVPSTQLNTLPHAERETLAQRRGLAPDEHALTIKGDLDWIAMKALEKNRIRRYESAAALAADVQRYLEHKPVLARAPSAAYVLGKFVRRHRFVLIAAGAIALAGITAAWQAFRAERAERERTRLAEKHATPSIAAVLQKKASPPAPRIGSPAALARAREFVGDLRENFFADCALASREDWVEALAQHAVDAFDHVPLAERDAEWRRSRAFALARSALAQRRQANPNANAQAELARKEIEDAIAAGDASEEAVLLLATACLVAYEPILTQRIYGPHPDAPQRAAALQRAEALLQPLALEPIKSSRARHLYAEVLAARAGSQPGEAALGLLRQALALVDGLDAAQRAQIAVRLTRAHVLAQLGQRSSPADRVKLEEEAIALADTVLAERPESPSARRVKFWAYWVLAELSRTRYDNGAELAQLTSAEPIALALHGNDPSNDDDWYFVLLVRRALAGVLVELGRITDALAVLYQTAVDGGHPATQPQPVEGGSRRYIKGTLERIALQEAERGNFAAAEQVMEAQQIYVASLKVPAGASERAGLTRDGVAAARVERQIAMFRADYEGVRVNGERVRALLTTLLGAPESRESDRAAYHSEVASLREHLAEALVQTNRFAEAEAMLKATAELRARNIATYTMRQRTWLAMAVARQGRHAEALELLAPVTDFLRPRYENRIATLDQRQLLGHALVVETIAQPPTDAGRARRAAALMEAQRILDTMTAEVRQLYAPRLLARWLTAERN